MSGYFSTPKSNLALRHRVGTVWKTIFFLSTLIGLLALAVLVTTIAEDVVGLVAVTDKIDRTTLSDQPLEELNKDELIAILQGKLSANRLRTLQKNGGYTLEELSTSQTYDLVIEYVVVPTVQESYPFFDSIFHRAEIEAEVADKYPDAKVFFYSWLNGRFLTNTMSVTPQLAGIRTALFGSLWIIAITVGFAFPIGVGAAIYLEEYANRSMINRIIQTNIDNLAGVPSIVYGILGLAIFVRTFGALTSGKDFGVEGVETGRTILSAGLTMGLLVLPILIINAQEAIRAVPGSLRQASYGLGATQWQTIWHHVLPSAFPGILTGTILAVSRAIGETAPLILVGASSLINKDPQGIFSYFTALPIQIYNWTSRPQAEFRNIAAAAIIVLLVVLLSLNAVAIITRNRLTRRSS
jgi:phosphate transport system permease protein